MYLDPPQLPIAMQEFEAPLVKPDEPGAWTYLVVPFSVEDVYGTRAQLKVLGSIDDCEFQGTLMPRGDGTHFLVVKAAIREKIQKGSGDSVQVRLEKDDGKREIECPSDFELALKLQPAAEAQFKTLTYSHKKEYIDWIEGAKRASTRQNRILKAVQKLSNQEKLNS